MSNTSFTFKQFSVEQAHSAFKVGTDSVVLGAWAEIAPAGHILDIGTGTGLLALMCAQRHPQAHIHALEKDGPSATEAAHNFSRSPWADRLTVEPTALEDYLPGRRFDYLICNPPYFLQALLPPDDRRAAARHANEHWFGLLAKKVDAWSTEHATFGCVLPLREFEFLRKELALLQWNPVRIQHLLPYPGGDKGRVLAEWQKAGREPLLLPDLYVRTENREYSPAYRTLTEAFYLRF